MLRYRNGLISGVRVFRGPDRVRIGTGDLSLRSQRRPDEKAGSGRVHGPLAAVFRSRRWAGLREVARRPKGESRRGGGGGGTWRTKVAVADLATVGRLQVTRVSQSDERGERRGGPDLGQGVFLGETLGQVPGPG